MRPEQGTDATERVAALDGSDRFGGHEHFEVGIAEDHGSEAPPGVATTLWPRS